MFVILLKFSDKSKAPALMSEHNEWLQKGFEDGLFLMSGSLQPGLGGTIFAHSIDRSELEQRVQADPFVAEGVVTTEILEISPTRFDDRMAFLAS